MLALLVTDNVDGHFYNWVDGAYNAGVHYKVCRDGNYDDADVIVTDSNVKFSKPSILWLDFVPRSKCDSPVFLTRPDLAQETKKLKIDCKVQHFYYPPRSTIPSKIIYGEEDAFIESLKKEIHWENFYRYFCESDLEDAKLIICNAAQLCAALPLTRAWCIPAVAARGCIPPELLTIADTVVDGSWAQGVKMAINKKQQAYADALRRAGMKYSNLDSLTAKAKELVPAPVNLPQPIIAERRTMVRRIVHKPEITDKKYLKNTPYSFTRCEYTYPNVAVVQTPNWFTKDEAVKASVIVPLFRSNDVVEDHVKSWSFDEDYDFEIIFVNDACPNNSFQSVLSAWAGRKLNRPIGKVISLSHNSGFATACNEGAKFARGEVLIFLNADTTLTPGWLSPMVKILDENSDVGIVGNLQLKADGTVDSAGSEWMWDSMSFEHIGRNVFNGKRLSKMVHLSEAPPEMTEDGQREMVTGCCMAMKKEFFDKIGGFDVGYRIGYWEDADLSLRCRESGKNVYFTSKSQIYHKGGHSRGGGHPYMVDNTRLFYDKWVNNNKINSFVKNEKI